MKKVYIQPTAEVVKFNSLVDFLTESDDENPLAPPDNEMGESTGDITPGGGGGIIW